MNSYVSPYIKIQKNQNKNWVACWDPSHKRNNIFFTSPVIFFQSEQVLVHSVIKIV